VPFALDQQLLSPLTQISLAPLWLRLPSTVLAIATWLVLSRGVLGAALSLRAGTARIRLLAAACLLSTWLPFNLGTRPESYVALGVTIVLALAMRARSPIGLGLMVLTVALTMPISPNSVLLAAPILVFAPRLLEALRATAPSRVHLATHVLLLCCVGAVTLTVIFGDQSWDALVTATDWHTFFGPSLPWYDEPDRYHYLLQQDQQGSFAKRLPLLLSVAILPLVGLLVARRRDRDFVGRAAVRLGAVTLVALLLFSASPSKWSYHLGAAAGLFAALLTVGVVLMARRARTPDRYAIIVGIAGSALVIAAVTLAFNGPNAWWLPAVYDVPWASEPPRPLGIPLDNPLPWIVIIVASALLHRRRPAQASTGSPAVVAVVAIGVVLALLLGSFVAAPLRRPEGSLAVVNLHRLTDSRVCGLADEVQLLPDGPRLSTVGGGDQLAGFVVQGGYPPNAPPPDPPGTGASTYLWGSRTPDDRVTGSMTSAWFALPPQPANGGVALSVSGRTDDGNGLTFEFGRSGGADVVPLGDRTPVDRPAADEDPAHPLWRTIGVDASDLPAGADRIRIHAVDGRSDASGWLAITGPRLRSFVPLNQFLDTNGPVLVSWPQAFLFPCVHDVVKVSGGVATTPRTVIESPRPLLADDRKRDVGGVFAAVTDARDLREIPSRLVGHPEVDWGSVLVNADPAGRDAYQRTVTRALVPGAGGTRHVPPEH
jgi:arabinosyltransferase B